MHYVAVLVFYALASALLSKSFDGYVVRQGDIQNWVGMSKEAKDAAVLFGEKPGWTNSMFGGMPATHILPSKPSFDVVSQAKRVINSLVGYNGISVFWLAMIGGYILALALGASPWIALLCGVGMGLSSFEVLYFSAGHNTKVQAIAYMPFVLAGVVWAYRGACLRSAWRLCDGMHVSSGHPQMTYYCSSCWWQWTGRDVAIGCAGENGPRRAHQRPVLLAGIIGVLPSYAHLKETQEYAQYTIRVSASLKMRIR